MNVSNFKGFVWGVGDCTLYHSLMKEGLCEQCTLHLAQAGGGGGGVG